MSVAPRVSVVMPVHDCRRWVGEAVASILEQTYRDIELIVVDDGSTDGSDDVVTETAAGDARVRLVRQERQGVIGALNQGLALARGELFARIDADDVAVPERLARQVAYLDAHRACVCVWSRVLLIDADGDPLREMGDRLTHEEIDAALLGGEGQVLYHCAILARTDAIRALGGYRDYETVEDLDLFLRLAEVGRLANLPEPLMRYRQHPKSVGHARMADQQRAIGRVLAAARARRGLPAKVNGFHAPARALSLAEQEEKWAWWALGAGHVRNARKHATRAVARRPLSPASWKVFACAIRGR